MTAPSVDPRPLPEPAALVPPVYARLLRLVLQDAGVDADATFAAAGIDPSSFATGERRLDRTTVLQAVQAAIAATRRPWLGLDLGSRAPVSAHGALGYAAVTAPDLRHGLRAIARYATTRNDALAWAVVESPAGLVMTAQERVALGAARGFVLDTTLAAILRMVEAAVGRVPPSLAVDLPFAAPAWQGQYARLGVEALRFGQPWFVLRVAADDLARPCLGADPRAHVRACRECEETLAEAAGASLARRVAGWLATVDGGAEAYPRLADVARRCGVSPRTLIRRLADEGTRWQVLLDDARRERARWLLQHTDTPIEAIAERLGYQDTSNFSRTVRRWFGMTPRAVRDRGRTASARS